MFKLAHKRQKIIVLKKLIGTLLLGGASEPITFSKLRR